MNITMHDESDLTLSHFQRPDLEVNADAGTDVQYSSMQMFATSLGLCTASVLARYARQFVASIEDLSIRIIWSYAEEPRRIDHIEMLIDWPTLPDDRLEAAEKAAEQCTLHNTLRNEPIIETKIRG